MQAAVGQASGDRRDRAAWLSLVGAVVILVLKFTAFLVTGSIGFLSDAAESLVNLVAGAVLIIALTVSEAPPDYRHPYGHAKAEYLSSVLEAALIIVAASVIAWSGVSRLLHPEPLTHLAIGIAVSALAAAANLVLALYLFRVARQERSAALDANARHVLTDVYTSLGVIVGVLLVSLTGAQVIDALLGLAVAVNIVIVGVGVMRRSLSRLLDERLPAEEEAKLMDVLEAQPGILGFHRLRTRTSGRVRFAEVDVFVDPRMTVEDAHALVGRLEDAMHAELDDMETTVHVEPFVEGVRDKTLTPKEEFAEVADEP